MLNFRPEKIPLDILPTLLESLSDRRDWHACALVNWAFNVAATPLLYRTLDSKIISQVSARLNLSALAVQWPNPSYSGPGYG
jgi:hypothetical protein